MLLIAGETLRGSRAVIEVAREMSLKLHHFRDAAELDKLLKAPWRRIVLLGAVDVRNDVVELLCAGEHKEAPAVMIAADQPKLRSSERAALVDQLAATTSLEWLGSDFDFDALAASARHCRRAMLRVSCDDLERAFDEDQFVVRYQPKVERSDDRRWITREAEALVRWQHPEHGLIGPLEFLPEIEEFGLMPSLTEFVLAKTARQLVKWAAQGLELNGCINLAPSLLADTSLGERYKNIVEREGVRCERFTFEVVEQDLECPEAPHLKALGSLRAAGFRLSLDDFRIAAASLATFEQLPFDEIKVHASAIIGAQKDPVSLHVLAAVTGLAHNLGMSVCAEGVEDQQTFDFLQTIECDKMQGFLISEAVIPDIIQRTYSATDSEAGAA